MSEKKMNHLEVVRQAEVKDEKNIKVVIVSEILNFNGWVVIPDGLQTITPDGRVPLLWQHGTATPNIPIGWVDNYEKGEVKVADMAVPVLRARLHFWTPEETEGLPADLSGFPQMIWEMWKSGIPLGVSIGFTPVGEPEYGKPTYSLWETSGKVPVFSRWMLHEVSVVSVGADPLALAAFRQNYQPKVQMHTQGAVPYEDTPLMDRDEGWDADAAVQRLRKWASSDGSGDPEKIDWAKYRRGFGWYDSDNPEIFGSYKLPHHDIVEGRLKVNFRGVAAAIAALHGGRGGVDIPKADIPEVESHLDKHRRQFEEEDLTKGKETGILEYSPSRDGLLRRLSRAFRKP
ncbi:hypothetical protein [Thermogutta sp.]|uniref:hypothetical protein n=1 Tax=Thermogutta sp. TaxID=1962930 RepID=UPI00321F9686